MLTSNEILLTLLAGSIKLSSIRLSVRYIVRPPHPAAVGLLLWAQRSGDTDRLLHGRRLTAIARSVTLSGDVRNRTDYSCFRIGLVACA